MNIKFNIFKYIICVVFLLLPLTAVGMEFIEAIKDGDGILIDGLDNPNSVTVSPDNNHVYVVSGGKMTDADDSLVAFTRNPSTGKLKFIDVYKNELTGVQGLEGAQSVTISLDGKYVYVASHSLGISLEGHLVVFSRNLSTGRLKYIEKHLLTDAYSLVISSDNKYIYVTSPRGNAINVFSRNVDNGKLTLLENKKDGENGVNGLVDARYLELSHDNNFIYVLSLNNAVTVFQRNPENGGLTFLETYQNELEKPRSFIITPDNKHVYVIDYVNGEWGTEDTLVLFSRNLNNGKLTFVKRLSSEELGLDDIDLVRISPDNKYVYVIDGGSKNNIVTFSYDTNTGELIFVEMLHNAVNNTNEFHSVEDMIVSSDGKYVYLVEYQNDTILTFKRNVITGTLTFVDTIQNGTSIVIDGLSEAISVAISPDNKNVYLASNDDDTVLVFSRNSNDGKLTLVDVQVDVKKDPISGVEGLDGVNSVTVSTDGKHVYVASSNSDAIVVFSRNIMTGVLTFVENKKEMIDGVNILNGVDSVIVSTNNRYIYAVVSKKIIVFKSNIITGTLTFVEMQQEGINDVIGIKGAHSLVISPDNKHLYVINSNNFEALAVFSIDINTGKLTFVEMHKEDKVLVEGKGFGGASSITVSPDNKHVYVVSKQLDTIVLFSRDSNTGKITFIEKQVDGENGVDGLRNANSVIVSQDGNHVYVVSGNWGINDKNSALAAFGRDSNTGKLTFIKHREDDIGNVDGLGDAKSLVMSSDNQHIYVASSEDNAVSVFTTVTNQPPINTIPTSQTTNEDTPLIFSTNNVISISDADVYSNLLEITLIADNGTLTLSTIEGLTFSNGSNDAAEMIFTGTITDINTALDGMEFVPRTGFNGATTITITTNDQGNTGGGGPKTDTDTINITVNAIIDKPSVTNAATEINTLTTNGLVISRNEGDGVEVTHFQITNITNGKLFQNDGKTPINGGDFITFAQGNSGLKFKPNSINNSTFNIRSATCTNGICNIAGGVKIAEITVNTVPELANIDVKPTLELGSTLNFTVNATDNQNNSLRYTLGSPLEGADLNPTTGKFTWTPTSSNNYKITIVATEINGNPRNLSDDKTITVNVIALPIINKNQPIVIPPLTFGEELKFKIIGTHQEGFPLVYDLGKVPQGVNINPENGTITWESVQTGTYKTTVKLTETKYNSSVEKPIEITVAKAKTGLTLNLDSSSIFKDDGIITITGKLTSYPDIKQNLANLAIQLQIISPNGELRTEATQTYSETGEFILKDVAGFDQEGIYTIQALFNGTKNLAAPDPRFIPNEYLQVSALAGHAIIIQGRIKEDEDGQKTHNKSLNRVYRSMRTRGFEDDNIEYLNYNYASNDPSKTDIYIDGIPSKIRIKEAFINTQIRMNANPGPLYIVMVDHGGVDGSFYIDDEIISPSELNNWLIGLENGLIPQALEKERVTIIGACYSGSYIPTVSKEGRIIVTSTTETEESYKGPKEPDKVRSGEFFIEALFAEFGKGKSLQKSFNIATESVEILTRIGGNAPFNHHFQDWAAQHPLLDDNGDGKGSNIIPTFLESKQEGIKAKTTYLGLGKRFKFNDPDNPAEIIKVTPTDSLNTDQNTKQLFAIINNPNRVDNQEIIVDIRSPSVTLINDGIEHKGQLEINGLERIKLTLREGNKFTGNFAGFTEPGKYEVFYFVQDNITKAISPLKHSVIYKNNNNDNKPPYAFNLLSPVDGEETTTVVIFDWDKTFDPDNDPLSYTLIIEDANNQEVLRQEGLNLSMGYVDNNTIITEKNDGERAGLRDRTKYFWKVEAIDSFGNTTSSSSFSFNTNNKNNAPSINSISIISDHDSPLANIGKSHEATIEACDNLLCYYFLTDGLNEFNIPALGLTIPPNHGSETANYHNSTRTRRASFNLGKLQFSIGSIQVKEKQGTIEFLVERIDGNDGEVSVSYASLDNTATNGIDYNFANNVGNLTWKDGDTHSQRISINIVDDQYFEGNELFTVMLLNTSNKNLLRANSQITVEIVDDEFLGDKIVDNDTLYDDPMDDKSVIPSEKLNNQVTVIDTTPTTENIFTTCSPILPQNNVFEFVESSYKVGEGDGNIEIEVKRLPSIYGCQGNIRLEYEIVTNGSTATLNDDYTYINEYSNKDNVLPWQMWQNGECGSKPIYLNIIDDQEFEGNEKLVLRLLETGINITKFQQTELIIIDNDEHTSKPICFSSSLGKGIVEPPELFDNNITFSAEIIANNCSQQSVAFVNTEEEITIKGEFIVPAAFVGEEAEIVVFGIYTSVIGEKKWFTKLQEENLSWINSSDHALIKTMETKILKAVQNIDIYTGSLPVGNFEFYLGYRFQGDNSMFYNGEQAIKVFVND